MKTGNFVYTDHSVSEELDSSKTVKGVLCVMTDNPEHKIVIGLKDAPEKQDWYDCKAYCEDNYMRMPTIKESSEIYAQKDAINKALELAGGEPLKEDGYYWSSTEYDYYTAWKLNLYNGYRSCNNKNFTYYVRPVLAF